MEHLLSAWPQVAEQFKNARHILLLTDYDGTLTSIVERPELANLPMSTRLLLQALARQRHITLGVLSGRALADLKRRVGIGGIIYAGNHGLEMEGPSLSFVNPLAEGMRPVFRVINHVLTRALGAVRGARVEDKGLTLSVHYRQVAEEEASEVKDIVHRTVSGAMANGRVRVTHGKKVLEIKPDIGWDKGKALQLIMKRYSRGGRLSGLLPVYLGDDLTDEDGFNFIEKYGNGISVFVGEPKTDSRARYFLKSPEEVTGFLGRLLELAQRGSR